MSTLPCGINLSYGGALPRTIKLSSRLVRLVRRPDDAHTANACQILFPRRPMAGFVGIAHLYVKCAGDLIRVRVGELEPLVEHDGLGEFLAGLQIDVAADAAAVQGIAGVGDRFAPT